MKPWDIYTFDFPEAGPHPAVILSTDTRLKTKARANVLLCSSQRTNRAAEPHEVLLDPADGLDWPTLCKCDLLYDVPLKSLKARRGSVSLRRRREISIRVIRSLGLAGF